MKYCKLLQPFVCCFYVLVFRPNVNKMLRYISLGYFIKNKYVCELKRSGLRTSDLIWLFVHLV